MYSCDEKGRQEKRVTKLPQGHKIVGLSDSPMPRTLSSVIRSVSRLRKNFLRQIPVGLRNRLALQSLTRRLSSTAKGYFLGELN